MSQIVTSKEYQALAELRYRLRQFLREGDSAARASGLEPQQYQFLLALRGLPDGTLATIQTLSGRMAMRHHSAVGLVDRLELKGYVRRSRSSTDRRQVLVTLLPRGRRLLDQVAAKRISELRGSGKALVGAISALLEPQGRAEREMKNKRKRSTK